MAIIERSTAKMWTRNDYLTLSIPKGYGRLFYINEDKGSGILISESDTCSKELGTWMNEEENITPILAIMLEDYRQSEAYATAFKMLAKHMKEGAKNG